MNFVIYHAALRQFLEAPDDDLAEFERTGPHTLGPRTSRRSRRNTVSTMSMARSAPAVRQLGSGLILAFAAAFDGAPLIKGMGFDHVCLGKLISVWVRLAAMADRGVPPARNSCRHGPEAGGLRRSGQPMARSRARIFGYNSARLYKLDLRAELPAIGKGQNWPLARAASLPRGDPPAISPMGYVGPAAPEAFGDICPCALDLSHRAHRGKHTSLAFRDAVDVVARESKYPGVSGKPRRSRIVTRFVRNNISNAVYPQFVVMSAGTVRRLVRCAAKTEPG